MNAQNLANIARMVHVRSEVQRLLQLCRAAARLGESICRPGYDLQPAVVAAIKNKGFEVHTNSEYGDSINWQHLM